MKILAIESSGLAASVAIATEGRLIAEYTTNFKKTHSETLMPMIDEIVRSTDTDLKEIDAIAICSGPGSFTGLRIGAATAKGLGLALGRPLVAVPTLQAMAYNFYGANQLVAPMLDARRDQVFAGVYTFSEEFYNMFSSGNGGGPQAAEAKSPECGGMNFPENGSGPQAACANGFSFCMEEVVPGGPMAISELIEKLNAIGEDVIFSGDGAERFRGVIEQSAAFPFTFAPLHKNAQTAASVAALAVEHYKKGITVPAADFAPDYMRVSQAERESGIKL